MYVTALNVTEVYEMREKYIEQALRKAVKAKGGMALKLISPGFDGVPDRIALMPNGKMAFVELKSTGRKMRSIQIKRKKQLESLGFSVYCIDRPEQIGGVLDEINKG